MLQASPPVFLINRSFNVLYPSTLFGHLLLFHLFCVSSVISVCSPHHRPFIFFSHLGAWASCWSLTVMGHSAAWGATPFGGKAVLLCFCMLPMLQCWVYGAERCFRGWVPVWNPFVIKYVPKTNGCKQISLHSAHLCVTISHWYHFKLFL